ALLPLERDPGVVPPVEDPSDLIALHLQRAERRLGELDLVAGDEADDRVDGATRVVHREIAGQRLAILLKGGGRRAGAAALILIRIRADPLTGHIDGSGHRLRGRWGEAPGRQDQACYEQRA